MPGLCIMLYGSEPGYTKSQGSKSVSGLIERGSHIAKGQSCTGPFSGFQTLKTIFSTIIVRVEALNIALT